MSQGDQDIANQSRTSFRADLNAELQALVSLSSGATEPATKYAYQLWADTTDGVIKQRDAANAAWHIRAPLSETMVQSVSSGATFHKAHFGCTFICTSSFTFAFDAAATLTGDWYCFIRNDGSGVITLDPNASETIDGFTTLALQPGESCRIACNGSAFKTQGLTQPRMIVRRKTADESVTSSTTLQNDDHLTFAIGANEEWFVEVTAILGTSLTTTGYRVGFNVPAGAIMQAWGFNVLSFVNSVDQTSGTTSPGAVIISTPTNGNIGNLKLFLWVLNGATPGTVDFQWCPNVNIATALTFKKGSAMRAERLA